jgi:iron complex outermembrane receptor protein
MCVARSVLAVLIAVVLCFGSAVAGEDGSEVPANEDETAEDTARDDTPGEPDKTGYEETVVVTASRSSQPIDDAPAAVTVFEGEQLEAAPADELGDVLRTVPGLNVAQTSAGEFLISGRQATSVLPRGQQVMIDNRTIYQDFTGSVLWSVMPFGIGSGEIDQVETVRGPTGAVWGANATEGIINILTKAPKDMVGTSVTLGVGELDTLYGNVTHAGTAGKLGYMVSAGWYEQSEYERPTGTIPGSEGPLNPGGTPYPEWDNKGTQQPKLNLRFDFDQNAETTWSFSGGYAGTDSAVLTQLGPFDFDSDTSFSYFKADWKRKAARVSIYTNLLDGSGEYSLSGAPFEFDTDTYAVDFVNNSLVAPRHLLTYGATFRHNKYDLSIITQRETLDQFGVFLEDEMRLGEKLRWVIGARWDDIEPVGSFVSPRTSFIVKTGEDCTLRFSFNRAYNAPTVVENFGFIPSALVLTLPGPTEVIVPTLTLGNEDLEAQRLDSFEVGWNRLFDKRYSLGIALYRTKTTDFIRLIPVTFYSSTNPPPGWPLPPRLLDIPPPLPETFSWFNFGEAINQGVEASLGMRLGRGWTAFVNYSWQDEPEVTDIPPTTLPNGEEVPSVNIPPANRFNVGAQWNGRRFYASGDVNYQDEAFWTDVLGPQFWGPTDSFIQLNLGFGVRFKNETIVLSVYGQNLLDADAQQHVFGEIIGRKVSAQVRFIF